MVKKVTIRIQGGKVSADYQGFVGTECQRLEERIRPAGLEVDETVDKAELHAGTQTETTFQQY